MKNSVAKSAYLGWLTGALTSHPPTRRPVAPDDLVLGYATGYDAAMIAPFVRSLRAVFDGHVALVVDDDPDIVDLLTDHDVDILHPDQSPGWEPHPVVARFADYARILERYSDVQDVLLTDVRDVIFQAEPFGPPPRRMEVFVEYENGSLGDHAFNMKHMAALVGDEMAAALAHKPCICVGTVIGPRQELLRFCRLLLMLAAIPRSEMGGAFGADQAACNLAIHLDLIHANILPNYKRVATVGMTDGDSLVWKDRILNPDGSTSAIVHQYDRHPHLADAVHERWGHGHRICHRVQPKTAADRGRKLRQSLLRRLPELR